MPEMQLCDGSCGHMELVSSLTKLKCTHVFCQMCLPEGKRTHTNCVAPSAETITRLARCETATETDRSTADSALNETIENQRVVFEYNKQRAVLWIRPRTTYAEMAAVLGGIFGIPADHKITFIFDADQSVTGMADSASPSVNTRFARARLPSSGVVLLTTSSQTP
ncbi:hypothetical protein GCK32_015641 [Trichostrongylus colubriformis]|uniref:RING-type domain-containing protein n=1 Tax=Trichostrongylus colubriformis TaxID=6319 RepID=A0AAN8IVE3_TRICO